MTKTLRLLIATSTVLMVSCGGSSNATESTFVAPVEQNIVNTSLVETTSTSTFVAPVEQNIVNTSLVETTSTSTTSTTIDLAATATPEAQYWSDLPNGPWYSSRLGDQCKQAMLKEFVDIKIGATDALSDALDGAYAIGVVTSRQERNYVPTDGGLGIHDGEIQIEVYVICGKAGSQNSPYPAITPGGMSTIYSYGGDSMVIGNTQRNDVVGYFSDSYGYGWYLQGKPNAWFEIDEAVRKASKRVGG
jgi:hypothetical protein